MKELQRVDIKWEDSATFQYMNKALIKKMREAGAVRLIFGLESCSKRILRYIGKNISLSQVEKNLKSLWEAGIQVEVNLICGFPYERISDIKKTIEFLRRNKKYIKVAYVKKFFLDGKMRAYPEKYKYV
jgi:radical SAM superfamily enzyme YgiQ (UPF0313 family)